MTCYLYIAKARTGKYYTGISADPESRVNAHNNRKGSRFALQQGPFKLVYVSPPFVSKGEARKFEIKVKDWSQAKKEKLIKGEWSLI